ncbi:hypothetical protein L3Y34_006663 [Caenorhabditis briggsae]|uniref:DUF38 domain-containing protein n=2 Tax=Caenorhabditis briggsae TaxID=6238 RepID=A0AAE9A4J0_CAEBR|nr:hypothetical protein L3Y34_006663 [Caenorhabditis briggsae]
MNSPGSSVFPTSTDEMQRILKAAPSIEDQTRRNNLLSPNPSTSTLPNPLLQHPLRQRTHPPQVSPVSKFVNQLDQNRYGNIGPINHGNIPHWPLRNGTVVTPPVKTILTLAVSNFEQPQASIPPINASAHLLLRHILNGTVTPQMTASQPLVDRQAQKIEPQFSSLELPEVPISSINGGQRNGKHINGALPGNLDSLLPFLNRSTAPQNLAFSELLAAIPTRSLAPEQVSTFEIPPVLTPMRKRRGAWSNGAMVQKNGEHINAIDVPAIRNSPYPRLNSLRELEHLANSQRLVDQQAQRFQSQQIQKLPPVEDEPQQKPDSKKGRRENKEDLEKTKGRQKNKRETPTVVKDSPNHFIDTYPTSTEEMTQKIGNHLQPRENQQQRTTQQIWTPPYDHSVRARQIAEPSPDPISDRSINGYFSIASLLESQNVSVNGSITLGTPIRNFGLPAQNMNGRHQVNVQQEDKGLEEKADEQVEDMEWMDDGGHEELEDEASLGQQAPTPIMKPIARKVAEDHESHQNFLSSIGSDPSYAFVKFGATPFLAAGLVQPYQAIFNSYPHPEASTSTESHVVKKSQNLGMLMVNEVPTNSVPVDEVQNQPDSIEAVICENFIAPTPPNSLVVGEESHSLQVISFGNGAIGCGEDELEQNLKGMTKLLGFAHPDAKDQVDRISNEDVSEEGVTRGVVEHKEQSASRNDQSSEALNALAQEMDPQDIEDPADFFYALPKRMTDDSVEEALGQENAQREGVSAREEAVMVPEPVEEAKKEGDGYFQMDDGVPESEERVLVDDVEMDDVMEEVKPEAQEQEEEAVENRMEEMVIHNSPIATIVIRDSTVILTFNGIEQLEVPALDFGAILQRLRQVEVIEEFVFMCDGHLCQLADSITNTIVDSLQNEGSQIPAARFVYKCSSTGAVLFMELLKKFNPQVLKSVKVENEKFPGVFICDLQDLEQWKNLEALEIVPMVPADANEDYFLAMDDFKVTLSSASNYEIISLETKFKNKEPKIDVLPRFDIKTIAPSKIKKFADQNGLKVKMQNGILMFTRPTRVPEQLAVFRFEPNRLRGKYAPRDVVDKADDLSIFFD